MNFQIFVLLLSMLLQGSSELVMPNPLGGVSGAMQQDPSAQCKVGYGTDPYGKYCMITQIPPSAISAFAKGDQGHELSVDIRNDYRNYVERIIFRVGIGEVENSPPPPNRYSENRSTNPAFLSTLENRSTVPIDRNSDTKFASQSNFPTGNGDAVMPNGNNTSINDRNRLAGGMGIGNVGMGNVGTGNVGTGNVGMGNVGMGNVGMGNVGMGNGGMGSNSSTPVMPNGPSSSLTHRNEFDNLGPQTNTQVRDDSSSRQPFSVSNMIKPTQPYLPTANQPNYGQSTNGQGTSGQSSTYGTGQSYATGNLHGTTATGTNTSNQGYNPNTQNPTTYNANGNLQPYSAAQSNSPSTYPNQIGSQIPLLAQNYGAQTTQPPAYGTSGYPIIPNPNLNPNTSFAGTPIATNLPNQNGQTGPAKVSDEHNPTQESFLPFLLLFSIVGNVYLGLWMHHLRKRYRELRSSLRGIPISELA